MIVKQFFLLLLVVLFLNGCSSLNTLSVKIGEGRNFLTDTQADNVETPTEVDPVMESTRLALQTNSSADSAQTLLNTQLETQYKEPEFDNVWDRLPGMFQFSELDNQRIQSHQKWFLKHKNYLEKISQRASPYLYLITEEVNKRNMPGELVLLPVIESAFKTQAYSHMKASGLWQFMPATGRHFGLKQTWWYDGRRDVYKSTHAALTYLEQLNKYYKGDWMLALAAYNAGAGNVNKAVRKNLKKGKPIDYWSLDLPKETRNYVPKLLAVSKLIQHASKYNISLSPIANSPELMLVDTQSQIDLNLVAKMTDISLKKIQTYNPAFNRWATDPEGPHHLLLPIDKVERFEKQLALLDDKDRVQWHRHKIRSGESLSVVAHKYKISIKTLKKANHLKNNRIRAGKYLMVPVASLPDTKTTQIASANNSSSTANKTPANAHTYTVRKGDSFWLIARRHDMSHRKLASLNGLSPGDTLSIGQILIIGYKKPAVASLTPDNSKQVRYKVRQGDSLYVISKRFNVTINELKSWNGLNSRKFLQPGQELKVYVSDASQTI